MRSITHDDQFILRLRMRVEDAARAKRDIVGAALDAIREHEDQRIPLVTRLMSEVRRVEIHRGTETRYRINLTTPAGEGMLDLTTEALAENQKAFVEQYLATFDELLTFPKGAWPEFVNTLLHLETVVVLDGREDVDEEEIAIEGFIERIRRYKLTRDLHRSIREDDVLYWDDETDTILLRSARIGSYLKSGAHKVTLQRFGYLLRNRGIVRQTSFQRWVPSKDESGKGNTLYFVRLDPKHLGLTVADVVPDPTNDLPPDPAGAQEPAEGAQL